MSQVSLKLVNGKSYFTTGIFAAGIYVHDNAAILIDSGSDERSSGDILNALKIENLTPEVIINTHCHPDHCGGNYFFQKSFPNIKVYATYDEKILIEDPSWAPRCFCSNATPFSGLKNKHIAPQKHSTVTNVIPYLDTTITIFNENFRVITLPGHTPGSIGIITPDNVLYAGDALFGIETFNKHSVLFYTDIENTLASFLKLSALNINTCVLYHGGLIGDFQGLIKKHQLKILETKDTIFHLLQKKPLSIDLLTQQIIKLYHIPENIISFTLTQTTIRAYLAYLESEKHITIKVLDGLLEIHAI